MNNAVTAPMIHALDIHKRFGALEVLKGVSLDIATGEVVAVIGPSGSGKSTFLRCLNHLESINRGRIDIEGETLVSTDTHGACHYVVDPEIRRICGKMGMVFQHFNLFPHMTVLQNVIEAPLTVKGLQRDAIVPKAEELLRKVGLFDKRDVYPSRLSGGQKQRVAIARASADTGISREHAVNSAMRTTMTPRAQSFTKKSKVFPGVPSCPW